MHIAQYKNDGQGDHFYDLNMSNALYDHPLYRVKVELIPTDERVSLAYDRAKLVLQTYGEHGVHSAASYLT